jgi:hypothetical protein
LRTGEKVLLDSDRPVSTHRLSWPLNSSSTSATLCSSKCQCRLVVLPAPGPKIVERCEPIYRCFLSGRKKNLIWQLGRSWIELASSLTSSDSRSCQRDFSMSTLNAQKHVRLAIRWNSTCVTLKPLLLFPPNIISSVVFERFSNLARSDRPCHQHETK